MQLHDRSVIDRFLLFARPGGVEPQAQGTAISGVDEAPLSALMVAQSAAEPAGADFDAAGKASMDGPVLYKDSFVSRSQTTHNTGLQRPEDPVPVPGPFTILHKAQ
jgi:hypothetical protein